MDTIDHPWRAAYVSTMLGLTAGWPYMLISTTLQAWWSSAGGDIRQVGLLSLLTAPYLLKCLWAQWFDERGWLTNRLTGIWICQGAIALLILLMAGVGMSCAPLLLLAAAGMALVSATQDIMVDGYRLDVMQEAVYPMSAVWAPVGYRLAMVGTGGVVLMLADHLGWSKAYACAGAMMLVWMAAMSRWPRRPLVLEKQSFCSVWQDSLQRYRQVLPSVGWLLWLVSYRLADGALASVAPVFFLKQLGISLSMLGALYKGVGVVASVGGGLWMGMRLKRVGEQRALVESACWQSASMLAYAGLAWGHAGVSMMSLMAVVGLESAAAGMTACVIVSWIMKRCAPAYAAHDFAFFSALALLPRTVAGPLAGLCVHHLGWFPFWILLLAVSCFPWLFLMTKAKNAVT